MQRLIYGVGAMCPRTERHTRERFIHGGNSASNCRKRSTHTSQDSRNRVGRLCPWHQEQRRSGSVCSPLRCLVSCHVFSRWGCRTPHATHSKVMTRVPKASDHLPPPSHAHEWSPSRQSDCSVTVSSEVFTQCILDGEYASYRGIPSMCGCALSLGESAPDCAYQLKLCPQPQERCALGFSTENPAWLRPSE